MSMRVNGWIAPRLLAIFVVSIQLIGCSGKPLTVEQQLEKARTDIQEGKLEASVIELKNLLQAHPNNATGRLLLGRVDVEIGNGAGAEAELKRARALGVSPNEFLVPLGHALLLQEKYQRVLTAVKPAAVTGASATAEVDVVRAHAYLGLGKLAQASSALDRALKLRPELTSAQVAQAGLALAKGDLPGARRRVQKVLKSSPKSAAAWSMLGDIERNAGKAAQAAAAYRKAIANEHNQTTDRFKLAVVEVRMKDYKAATAQLDHFAQGSSKDPRAAYVQGLMHLQQKDYADAQTSFESVIRSAPNYLPALMALGIAHLDQGHYGQAAQYLAQVVAKAPRLYRVRLPLAIARYELKDYAGVESALKPAVAAKQADGYMTRLLAAADMLQGKTEQALVYLKQVAAASPKSSTTRAALGLGLMDAGDLAGGIKQLETATKLGPEGSQAQVILVLTYLRTHQLHKALAAAEQYRKAHPKQALGFNLIGGCYLGLQQQDRAKAAFEKALKLVPGDPPTAQNLGRLYIKDGKLDKALELYESVLKVHPKNVSILLSLAGVERAQGRAGAYAKTLRKAIAADGKALKPRLLLAQHYLDQGDMAQARSTMQPLQQKYLNAPVVMIINGQIQLAGGQFQDAIATLKNVTDAVPHWPKAHYLLGLAYAAANRQTDAVSEFREALSMVPNYGVARIALARSLLAQNALGAARKQVAALSGQYPRMPEVIALEGDLALREGQPEKAVAAFRRLEKQTPTTTTVIALADAQMEAGQGKGAIDTLESWTKNHPQDSGSRLALGNLYLQSKQASQAERAFQAVIQLSPNNVVALNNLAWLLRKKDPAAALKYARQAVGLAPKAPVVLDTYGMVLLNNGDAKKAVENFSQAVKFAPGHARLRYHLALGLARAGDQERAKNVLKELLSQKVKNPTKTRAQELLKSLGS